MRNTREITPRGQALLKDALLRTAQTADIAGIRRLLVHAKDDTARQWYASWEFEPSPITHTHTTHSGGPRISRACWTDEIRMRRILYAARFGLRGSEAWKVGCQAGANHGIGEPVVCPITHLKSKGLFGLTPP